MAKSNPTKLSPADQPRYCPVCGGVLDVQTQTFPNGAFSIFSCWNDKCGVYGRTASESDLCNLDVLAKWEALLRFDTFTGLAIPLYVTYSNVGKDTPKSRWEGHSAALHAGRYVQCPKCKGSCKAGYCPQTFWRQAKSTLPDCVGCKGKGFIKASHWRLMVEAQRLAHVALSNARVA